MAAAHGLADIVAAHRLVKDLFTPRPWAYWRELLVTGTAAWSAILTLILSDDLLVMSVAGFLAMLLWYRGIAMIHELTHQRQEQVPGFNRAWNLAFGVPWLLPSVMYEGVHADHHKKTTYGTANDPEYLPLAGKPFAIAKYIGFSFCVFPLFLARFLLGTPVSWCVPPLRRFLQRSASSYVINLGYRREMDTDEKRRLVKWESIVLAAWWPPIALTLLGIISWKWLACWYAVYTAVLVVNRLRMLTAHHFALDGEPVDHLRQFADSVDTPHGWWAELWAPLGMRFHALHHLFPTLPFHSMKEAYARLTAALPPDSFYRAGTGRGFLPSIRSILTSPSPPPA
jgi:fatty acid desaturase